MPSEAADLVAGLTKELSSSNEMFGKGIRILNQYNTAMYKWSKGIVAVSGALKGLESAFRTPTWAAERFRKTFESSYKVVGELENRVFLASQKLYAMSGSFKSVEKAHKIYQRSLNNIQKSTRLTTIQTEALFGAMMSGFKGLRTESTIKGIEGLTVAVANMGLGFEEAQKRVEDMMGVLNEYISLRRDMQKAVRGDIGSARSVALRTAALGVTGGMQQPSAENIIDILRYTQRSGRTGKFTGLRQTADDFYRYQQYGEELGYRAHRGITGTTKAAGVMEKSQQFAAGLMGREAAIGESLATAGALGLTTDVIGRGAGIAGGVGMGIGKVAGYLMPGKRGGGIGIPGAAAAGGGQGTSVYVTNWPSGIGGGGIGQTAQTVGIMGALTKGGVAKTTLKGIGMVASRAFWPLALAYGGVWGLKKLTGIDIIGGAKKGLAAGWESISGMKEGVGGGGPEFGTKDIATASTKDTLENVQETHREYESIQDPLFGFLSGSQQITGETKETLHHAQSLVDIYGSLASTTYSIIKDAEATSGYYKSQADSLIIVADKSRQLADYHARAAQFAETEEDRLAAQNMEMVFRRKQVESELGAWKAGVESLDVPYQRVIELQKLNVNYTTSIRDLNKSIRLGIGISYQDTIRMAKAMQDQYKTEKARAANFRVMASMQEKGAAKTMLMQKAQEAEIEAIKTQKNLYESLLQIREGYLQALQVRVFGTGGFAKIMPSRDEGIQFMAPSVLGASLKGFGGEIGEPGRYTTSGMKFPSGTDAYTQQYRKMFGDYGKKGEIAPWVFGLGDEAGYGQEVMRGSMKELSTASVKQSASMEKMANALVSAKQPGSPLYVVPVGGGVGARAGGYRPLGSRAESPPTKLATGTKDIVSDVEEVSPDEQARLKHLDIRKRRRTNKQSTATALEDMIYWRRQKKKGVKGAGEQLIKTTALYEELRSRGYGIQGELERDPVYMMGRTQDVIDRYETDLGININPETGRHEPQFGRGRDFGGLSGEADRHRRIVRRTLEIEAQRKSISAGISEAGWQSGGFNKSNSLADVVDAVLTRYNTMQASQALLGNVVVEIKMGEDLEGIIETAVNNPVAPNTGGHGQ